MKQKKLIYRIFLIIFVMSLLVYQPTKVLANDWIITPDPMPLNSDITFCIGALAPSGGGLPAGYKAEFEFPASFDLTGITISDTGSASELEIYLDETDCTGTPRITELTPTAANDRDAASVSGQLLIFILEDGLTSSQLFSLKIVAKGGATSLKTPGTAGNYSLVARVYDGSDNLVLVDADFMYVGSANQVNISAQVDTSITLALSDTSCALGTFLSSQINTCSYDVTINTNAGTGYIAYVRDDGNLRNATDDINDSADNATTVGSEEYGVATSNYNYASLDIDQSITKVDCTARNGGTTAVPSVGMNGTDYSFASETGPVANDLTTLCHSASIAATTPAGVYSQTLTITAVGQF